MGSGCQNGSHSRVDRVEALTRGIFSHLVSRHLDQPKQFLTYQLRTVG